MTKPKTDAYPTKEVHQEMILTGWEVFATLPEDVKQDTVLALRVLHDLLGHSEAILVATSVILSIFSHAEETGGAFPSKGSDA
jgi:hypothetical protein